MASSAAILAQSITICAPVVGGPLFAAAKVDSVFPRVIVQMLIWFVVPGLLGILVALAYRRTSKRLSATPRRSTEKFTDAGARFTGLSYACIAVLIGLANIRFTRLVDFTHEEVAQSSDWPWILLALGGTASITAVCYTAWFYGSRAVWPSKDRPAAAKRRDRLQVPYSNDSAEAQATNID